MLGHVQGSDTFHYLLISRQNVNPQREQTQAKIVKNKCVSYFLQQNNFVPWAIICIYDEIICMLTLTFLHRVSFQTNSLDCHPNCRKVGIGFGKKMRIQHKHNIRSIKFTHYSKKTRTGSNKGNPLPLPVKVCFPQSSVTFDIDFCWVIFAVQLLLWFLFCLSVFSNFKLLLQLTAQSARFLFNGLFFVTLLFGGLLITYNARLGFSCSISHLTFLLLKNLRIITPTVDQC